MTSKKKNNYPTILTLLHIWHQPWVPIVHKTKRMKRNLEENNEETEVPPSISFLDFFFMHTCTQQGVQRKG